MGPAYPGPSLLNPEVYCKRNVNRELLITDDKGRSNLNAEIVGGPWPCRNHVALSCHDG
jgi:hypothetical protein